jgi:hypothetical protein
VALVYAFVGGATVEDKIVTDPTSVPEVADYFAENIFARQPAGKMWSNWFGKRIAGPCYMRILIYVTGARKVENP